MVSVLLSPAALDDPSFIKKQPPPGHLIGSHLLSIDIVIGCDPVSPVLSNVSFQVFHTPGIDSEILPAGSAFAWLTRTKLRGFSFRISCASGVITHHKVEFKLILLSAPVPTQGSKRSDFAIIITPLDIICFCSIFQQKVFL